MSELRIIEPTRETIDQPGRVELDLPGDTVSFLPYKPPYNRRYGGSYHVYVSGEGDTAETAARVALAELLRTLRLAVIELEALAERAVKGQDDAATA